MASTEGLLGLDFETYASTDLPKHGLARYMECPDFTVLVAAASWVGPDGVMKSIVLDFVENYDTARSALELLMRGRRIVAHNAGFEQAVLKQLGMYLPGSWFVDSAVLARAAGAAGKLEAAGPQLLGSGKMDAGYALIKKFSVPGRLQEESGSSAFDPMVVRHELHDWLVFKEYCETDARLCLELALRLLPGTPERELRYAALTMAMNERGWHVDLPLVREMQRRYRVNVDRAVQEFRKECDAPDLNLASTTQLRVWCMKRGVRASSFDEAAVATLLKKVEAKLDGTLTDEKRKDYTEVRAMLHTKQTIGGSSLKKLTAILNTVGSDGRLHDQYLHIGAGATFRTTGRGVQMQNLKRLHGEGDDVGELMSGEVEWDNDRMASNLRQVFTAKDPEGLLVVGDFSSVESRGLAWLAGEDWKIEAYLEGRDMYRELAGLILGLDPDEVTKEQRTFGKVGELSCGYGAGAAAVREFAAGMGVALTEGEAAKLVADWRRTNPAIVRFWEALDAAMRGAVSTWEAHEVPVPHGVIRFEPVDVPESLQREHPGKRMVTLQITLHLTGRMDQDPVLIRLVHGVHESGRDLLYYKPSELKSGALWKDRYTDPKTGLTRMYKLYGGKMAGLLTQSLCREVFFDVLQRVERWTEWNHEEIQVVGQFHDEIVVETGVAWSYGQEQQLQLLMSTTPLPGFPLAAEIKTDHRYVK
jgi:DNA polymerase bacteriophage-type